MDQKERELIERLEQDHVLDLDEYKYLIDHRDEQAIRYLAHKARAVTNQIYGRDIYVRGLIEFSNICRNDCLYCGIRRSNRHCIRYRLTKEEILACCKDGYELGFRTFVLQSGEDAYFNDDVLCDIVATIRKAYPDCAITLSVGERSYESYQRLYDAGADRYLLRHETANREHYHKLHPTNMSYTRRMRCLADLRKIGYRVGVGMMVQSPFQTSLDLACDLQFIQTFKPDMCGIGPYIVHSETPFKDHKSGTLELTCFLLSVIRLIHPSILLPATTALGTIDPVGREKGVLAGANVIMPNVSPARVRKEYALYDNKICVGDESAQCRNCLEQRMEAIRYRVVTDRGDRKVWKS